MEGMAWVLSLWEEQPVRRQAPNAAAIVMAKARPILGEGKVRGIGGGNCIVKAWFSARRGPPSHRRAPEIMRRYRRNDWPGPARGLTGLGDRFVRHSRRPG